MVASTWEAPRSEHHGRLDAETLRGLPDSAFAFPRSRKEPLLDPSHVRNAIARFDQVKDVSNDERELAFANIKKAAQYFGVDMKETDWRQLGSRPHTPDAAQERG
jgi:hypothetical protein